MFVIKIVLIMLLLINSDLQATAVVFLQGTSRSGKSSICSEIEQRGGWDAVGSVYFAYCLQAFDDLFPAEFACIKAGVEAENIRHAITKDVFMFKDNLSEDQKNAVRSAAQQIRSRFDDPVFYASHMKEFSAFSLNEIHKCVKNGLHVLADVSWYVTQESIQAINPAPEVFSILTYCPFSIMLDRLLERNKISLETGNIMNYRFFIEPLKSFASLYALSTDAKGSIDTLEKATFLACLDAIEPFLPDVQTDVVSGFMMQEFTRDQLDEYRETFLKTFHDRETLYIVPKITYDLLVRTDGRTPNECADLIVTWIASKSI